MTVAICICTCRRPQLLGGLLGVLQSVCIDQRTLRSLMVVVVDNAPNGEARAVCEAAAASLPMKLVFVEEPQRGISYARNRALHEALKQNADFVAFVDDDDRPEPDWLAHLLAKQKATGADIVLGGMRRGPQVKTPAGLEHLWTYPNPEYDKRNAYGLPETAGTGNVLIRCELIRRMSPIGQVFRNEVALSGGEDTLFFSDARDAGAIMAACGKSIVNIHVDASRLTLGYIVLLAFRVENFGIWRSLKDGQHEYIDSRLSKARRQLGRDLLKLPVSLFPARRRNRRLWRLAGNLGALYGRNGDLFAYYGHADSFLKMALDVGRTLFRDRTDTRVAEADVSAAKVGARDKSALIGMQDIAP